MSKLTPSRETQRGGRWSEQAFTCSTIVRVSNIFPPTLPGPAAMWLMIRSTIPVLSNVEFTGLALDRFQGPVFRLTADAPPGPARNPSSESRHAFWKFGKRLMTGG